MLDVHKLSYTWTESGECDIHHMYSIPTPKTKLKKREKKKRDSLYGGVTAWEGGGGPSSLSGDREVSQNVLQLVKNLMWMKDFHTGLFIIPRGSFLTARPPATSLPHSPPTPTLPTPHTPLQKDKAKWSLEQIPNDWLTKRLLAWATPVDVDDLLRLAAISTKHKVIINCCNRLFKIKSVTF